MADREYEAGVGGEIVLLQRGALGRSGAHAGFIHAANYDSGRSIRCSRSKMAADLATTSIG
jgi:hypothetical protein